MESSNQTRNGGNPPLVRVVCPCGATKSITKKADERNKKKNRQYVCRSCQSKRIWTDPKYRESVLSNSLQSEPVRNKLRNIQKTDSYKEKMSKSSLGAWASEPRRARASETSKKLWGDETYRSSQVVSQSEKWGEEDYRSAQLQLRSDSGYRAIISAATRTALLNPLLREKMSEMSKRRWESAAYRRKLGLARSEWANGKTSSLERATSDILLNMQVEFTTQHPVDHYLFDFFIPKKGLLIECQGEYWHSLPKMKGSDAAKFRKIDDYFPDLRILYLFERDFMNPEIVRRKLAAEIFGKKEEDQKEKKFLFSDVSISPVSTRNKARGSRFSEPELFLQSFHYAGYGRSAKAVYGAFLDDVLVAVCKFSTVVRKEVATSMGLLPSQVLELDRFCIHPRFQKKNFASWLLSRSAALAFGSYPSAERLVAFADKTYGHDGTIYKASNWTAEGIVKPDYHYLSPEGIVVHKKTLYNHAVKLGQKEGEYAASYRYEKYLGKEKTKFSLRR